MSNDPGWPLVEPVILPYQDRPVACREYDPRAPLVAASVAAEVHRHSPQLIVEHIGSTSVPGCAGKGVVDLMLLYPEGELETAKSLLDALGFQRQTGRDPFPVTRPMRIGAIEFGGGVFNLHVHVIAASAAEAAGLRAFRNRLRTNPDLMADYVARKRQIIAAGVTDPIDYCYEKGTFVEGALGADRD